RRAVRPIPRRQRLLLRVQRIARPVRAEIGRMKLTSKQVKFQIAMWWPTRRRMTFVGGHSTLQLLGTALLVEGYKQRFFFPVLDRFFQMPLSEWTTVTVPYSRILQAKHDSRFTVRLITGLVLWSPSFLLALGFLAGGGLFTAEGLFML